MIFSPVHVLFNNTNVRSTTHGKFGTSLQIPGVLSVVDDHGCAVDRSVISLAAYGFITASVSYTVWHQILGQQDDGSDG